MPRISDIEDKGKEGLDLPGLPWFTRAVGSSLIRGGIYLLAGEPGIGKTTLSLQILGEIARQEVKVLYIPTEQSPADVKRVANRVFKSESPDASREIGTNLFVDTIDDLEMLPWLINHRILPRDSEYNGCQLVVLDSLQGGGLSSAVGKKYRALLSFIGTAKGTGITCMFVNHVTKSGGIAGPKALEHEVDCVVYIRRALRLRPLFVPKNRFGPALLDPLVLIMDEKGLRESPHTSAEANAVFGYSGIVDQFAEAQASVTIPRYGSRPGLNAPFLPSKKIQQLLKVLGTLKDIDVVDLSYGVSCYVPGRNAYNSVLDLPIVVALLSSYLHQEVDAGTMFAGEVDLTKQVRPPEKTYLAGLAELLSVSPQIKSVYLSDKVAEEFAAMHPTENGPSVGDRVAVKGVADLEMLIRSLWPSLADAKG